MKYLFLFSFFTVTSHLIGCVNIKSNISQKAIYKILPDYTHIFYEIPNLEIKTDGNIVAEKGELVLEKLKLINANFDFDGMSISCNIKDSLKNKKVIELLKSQEFLNIKKFPKINFSLSNNTQNDNISPYLTINGKTIKYNCNISVADIGKNRIGILVIPFVVDLSDFYEKGYPKNKNLLIIGLGIIALKN